MKHPNAIVGAGSTIGGGSLVLEVLSWFGVSVSNYAAIAIAAAVTGVVLFVGRKGVKGVWNLIVNGTSTAPAK